MTWRRPRADVYADDHAPATVGNENTDGGRSELFEVLRHAHREVIAESTPAFREAACLVELQSLWQR